MSIRAQAGMNYLGSMHRHLQSAQEDAECVDQSYKVYANAAQTLEDECTCKAEKSSTKTKLPAAMLSRR